MTRFQEIRQKWASNSEARHLQTTYKRAFVMERGRFSRALFSRIKFSNNRTARVAAEVGQFVATLFIVWGIFHVFFGVGFGGLWLVLTGWLLFTAAKASYPKIGAAKILSPLCVGEVMRRDCDVVSGEIDLQCFVNRHLLKSRNPYYIVTENDQPVGMITKEQVRKIPCAEWSGKTVREVMSTLDKFQVVALHMPVAKAYDAMLKADVNLLPVAANDHLAGVITRDDILEDLYTHVTVEN